MKKKILFFGLSMLTLGAFAFNKTNCCSPDESCTPEICCPDQPDCCETHAISEVEFDAKK